MRILNSWVLWNLFLASVPIALGYALFALSRRLPAQRRPAWWAGLVVLAFLWLAFVPNTCYLLTEWRHFLAHVDRSGLGERAKEDQRVLIFIAAAALFYLLYSGFGAVALTLSIRPVERLLRRRRVPFAVVAVPLFLLISLGVYLGLIRRLNSWDLWTRPGHVASTVGNVLRSPLLLAVVALFGLMLWMMYEAIDLWFDGVSKRLQMAARNIVR